MKYAIQVDRQALAKNQQDGLARSVFKITLGKEGELIAKAHRIGIDAPVQCVSLAGCRAWVETDGPIIADGKRYD